jgi:hypothetical protein
MTKNVGWIVAIAMTACVNGGGPGTRDAGSDAWEAPETDASTPEDDAAPQPDTGSTGVDADGDGVPVPADCDDTTNEVSPLVMEDCLTPRDEDCDGAGDLLDLDCDVDEDMDEDTDEDVDEDDDDDQEEEEEEK